MMGSEKPQRSVGHADVGEGGMGERAAVCPGGQQPATAGLCFSSRAGPGATLPMSATMHLGPAASQQQQWGACSCILLWADDAATCGEAVLMHMTAIQQATSHCRPCHSNFMASF